MQVIIIGKNRVEVCTVKKKDYNKHFFSTRSQLYRVYPDSFVRMKIDYFGKFSDEEVVIYPENSEIPLDNPNGIDYSGDAFLEDIHIHKEMSNGTWFKKKLSFSNIGSIWDTLTKFAIPILVVGVLAYAFIGQALGGS